MPISCSKSYFKSLNLVIDKLSSFLRSYYGNRIEIDKIKDAIDLDYNRLKEIAQRLANLMDIPNSVHLEHNERDGRCGVAYKERARVHKQADNRTTTAEAGDGK